MTGHQIAIVLDAYLTLDGRCRQITDLGNDGTSEPDQAAKQKYIYVTNGMCFIDPYAIQQAQYNGCNDAANGAFDRFLGAQSRTQFVFYPGNHL